MKLNEEREEKIKKIEERVCIWGEISREVTLYFYFYFFIIWKKLKNGGQERQLGGGKKKKNNTITI